MKQKNHQIVDNLQNDDFSDNVKTIFDFDDLLYRDDHLMSSRT